MLSEESHFTDEELLRAADGELSSQRAAEVNAHLERCWSCRARKQEIEGAAIDFVRLYRESLDPLLPPVAGPRALLKAQLGQFTEVPAPWWTRWVWFFEKRQVAIGTVCAVLLALGFRYIVPAITSDSDVRPVPLSLPDPGLTPGAIATASREQVCRSDLPKNRSVSPSLRHEVFAEYGIPTWEPKAYEVDYLISPALGGADDIRNLWPQSYSSAVWNAQVKDALEDRLHELVCEGKLDLVTAQHDIAANWILAYMTYFHTDRPREMER